MRSVSSQHAQSLLCSWVPQRKVEWFGGTRSPAPLRVLQWKENSVPLKNPATKFGVKFFLNKWAVWSQPFCHSTAWILFEPRWSVFSPAEFVGVWVTELKQASKMAASHWSLSYQKVHIVAEKPWEVHKNLQSQGQFVCFCAH